MPTANLASPERVHLASRSLAAIGGLIELARSIDNTGIAIV
jgi:hypothetical protein